jgi:hypothetical protein
MSREYLTVILEKYCDWLNLWMISEGSIHRYDISQFLVHDPRKKLYGSSELLVVIPSHYTVAYAAVTDGDEGGPAYLTAWLDIDKEDVEVVFLVQEFDTYVQAIYESQTGFLAKP